MVSRVLRLLPSLYRLRRKSGNGRFRSLQKAVSDAVRILRSPQFWHGEPIHEWFELTYAQYLTIPRSVLQSMPLHWQTRFVQCLKELDDSIDWRPDSEKQYRVGLWKLGDVENEDGEMEYSWLHEVDDPLMDYERGRRRLTLKAK